MEPSHRKPKTTFGDGFSSSSGATSTASRRLAPIVIVAAVMVFLSYFSAVLTGEVFAPLSLGPFGTG